MGTVQEAQNAKGRLEKDIQRVIEEYEDDHGVTVEKVTLRRVDNTSVDNTSGSSVLTAVNVTVEL